MTGLPTPQPCFRRRIRNSESVVIGERSFSQLKLKTILQGRLVDLGMCLLSQGRPLMKDIVSQFVKKDQKGEVLRSMLELP